MLTLQNPPWVNGPAGGKVSGCLGRQANSVWISVATGDLPALDVRAKVSIWRFRGAPVKRLLND